MPRPERRPRRPHFSSGPCAKRPGWRPEDLSHALVGRSHRCGPARERLRQAIERQAALLGLPGDWRLAILPASDTGAFEAALWNLLGPRGVDVVAFEAFGLGWWKDVSEELALTDARLHQAPYGELPDLGSVDFDRDVVLTWNGTTSGVKVPDGFSPPAGRKGLVLCDATSAVFSMPLPFEGLDVVTWSWQKALGGEAQHGMLALSPRALERLAAYEPARPIPKIFRLTKEGRPVEGLFRGDTINTPSMLCVEDVLDALDWAEAAGGREALFARTRANLAAVERALGTCPGLRFLVPDASIRSPTSITLDVGRADFLDLDEATRRDVVGRVARRLEDEGVAFDVSSYRAAPPGFRLWGGPTVDAEDLAAVVPWLSWALDEELARQR